MLLLELSLHVAKLFLTIEEVRLLLLERKSQILLGGADMLELGILVLDVFLQLLD